MSAERSDGKKVSEIDLSTPIHLGFNLNVSRKTNLWGHQ